MFAIGLVLATGTAQVATATAVAMGLSRELGVQIEVAAPLKNDLVFVEPHGSPAGAVLSALAAALHASVRETGSEFILQRSKADLAQIRGELIAERIKWLNRSLQQIVKYRAAHQGGGPPEAKVLAELDHRVEQIFDLSSGKINHMDPLSGGELLPSASLLEGLVSRIGLNKLASLPTGEVAVYEDDPVLDEQPLPPHEDLLTSYKTGMRPFQTVDVAPAIRQRLNMVGMSELLLGWGSTAIVNHLRLVEMASSGGLQFLLEGFDASGAKTIQTGIFAGVTDEIRTPQLILRTAKQKTDSRWVPLSAPAAEAVQFARGDKPGPLPPWFFRPDRIEPLNAFVREALEGIASGTPNEPVVISVSDSLWSHVWQCCEASRVNLDALEQTMAELTPYERLSKDGAVVWRPTDPESDESNRADRKILAQFAGDFADAGRVTLRSTTRLYRDVSAGSSTLAGAWFLDGQLSNGPNTLHSDHSDKFYRLLGEVSDEGWDRLMSGQVETCGELGIVSQTLAFLQGEIWLRTEGGAVPDLYRHPTELLSDGLSPDTPIKFEPSPIQMVESWNASMGESGRWRSIDVFQRDFPLDHFLVGFNGDTPVVKTKREDFEQQNIGMLYRFGVREDLTVKIGLPRQLFIAGHITGNLTPTSEPFTYAELPQAIRDRIWEAVCDRSIAGAQRMRKFSSTSHPPIPPPVQGAP